MTVWTIFPAKSTYFDPSTAPFMINYRVPDLARVRAELKAEGCMVDERIEESEYGKFGWVMDPEGNRLELWEPPAPPLKS
jgi:predicted enzyme related to lactoylglutathione lyase